MIPLMTSPLAVSAFCALGILLAFLLLAMGLVRSYNQSGGYDFDPPPPLSPPPSHHRSCPGCSRENFDRLFPGHTVVDPMPSHTCGKTLCVRCKGSGWEPPRDELIYRIAKDLAEWHG